MNKSARKKTPKKANVEENKPVSCDQVHSTTLRNTRSIKRTEIILDESPEINEENKSIVKEELTIPPYNVPERLIIVYDSASDITSTKFEFEGESYAPNDMLRDSLKIFIKNKNMIDKNHQFALVVLNDSNLVWLVDFTNNIETIFNALNDIQTCEPEDIINIDGLFELINEKVDIPDVMGNFNIPPAYVVRVLFTYGRSYTLPKLCAKDCDVKPIIDSPYFVFDVLMTHEMPNSNNNCIKIFQHLQSIDKKGISYFFPVGRDAKQLYLSMARLLAHPLQRTRQSAH